MGNLSDTDTESESSIDDWYDADLTQMSVGHPCTEEETMCTLDALIALQTLRGLDICAVKRDDQLHATVQRVSDALLSILDRIIDTERASDRDPDFRAALSALLSEPTLTLLLEYRVVFRDIASRGLQTSSSAVAVCWVDVILAKLGQSITSAAGLFYDVRPTDKGQPETLRAQKEEDMLRAAIQLPASWPEIIGVLGSSYASPAAVRLASTLTWGVYVMSEQLAENKGSKIAQPAGLFTSLQQRLKIVGIKRNQETHWEVAAERERLADAMFVSLYASSELISDLPTSSYRPYSYSILVEMIKAILQSHSDHVGSTSPIIIPASPLDLPAVILLKWGRTLPWSYNVWSDSRLYGSDVILQMTVTWLLHLDSSIADIPIAHSVEWWDDELVNVLDVVPLETLSMLSRVLQCLLSMPQGDQPKPFCGATTEIMLKACWSLKYLQTLLEGDNTPLTPLCTTLYDVFMLLGESNEELCVKDLILENLSLRPSTLKLAWATISHRSSYTLAWQRKLNSTYNSVNDCMQGAAVTMPVLRHLRQTLQVLTLAYKSGPACPLPSLTSRLLAVLLDWLEMATVDSAPWTMLCDVTIGALTEWQHRVATGSPSHRVFDRVDAARVWRIIAEADSCDLPSAASAAAHISSTVGRHPYESLQYGECWDHLRDTMLMILDHEFRGVEEPLALLVAPTISRALVALARYAPARARRYFVSSPWIVAMAARMRQLEDDVKTSGVDEYRRILWSQTSLSIQTLIAYLNEELSVTVQPDGLDNEREDSADSNNDLTFCWFHSRAYLIPT